MLQAYPGGAPVSPPVRKRPVGLVVIAILQIIGSIINIGAGASNLGAGIALGAANLVLGIIGLLVGVLMILGRSYTFVLAWIIISLVIGLALGGYAVSQLLPFAGTEFGGAVLGGAIAGIVITAVIYAIVIYYLTRPHVKAFFGKAPLAPPVGTVGVAPPPPPPQPAGQGPLCPSCGAQLQYVPQYQKYWCPNEQRYV
ncbi:hypothetical protein HRbin01_01905 [archaeon HR01]|nr:hypothetical protein HRbin01_01905 [archaeon HR01]